MKSADGEDAVAAINGVLDGDRHAWEVWHGLDFGAGGGEFASVGESRLYRRYAADRGKFISEFGIHASPELATLQRWLPKDQLRCTVLALIITTKIIRRTNMIRCWRS